MGYMDWGNLQAARERLLAQISILEQIREELEHTEYKIRAMSYVEQIVHDLGKNRQELEEEIRILRKMAECLEEIAETVQKTEQKIVSVYDLEVIVHPRTKFQTNRISIDEGCMPRLL